MNRKLVPVRDMIPERRISCARIREAVLADKRLAQWSRDGRDAIRPRRLALLLRRTIWKAHNIRYGRVRERVSTAADGKTQFHAKVEVQTDEGWQVVECCTEFKLRQSGRITAEMSLLRPGGRPEPITLCPILLKVPEVQV